MYKEYYGLKKKPFDLAPVGGLVYLSESHLEGISMLRYGVVSSKGFVLLTGGVGTGKTTVLNTLLGVLKKRVRYCVINNPKFTRHDFFFYLGKKIGIPYRGNKGDFVLRFTQMLHEMAERKEKFLLIIDEAQVFPIDLLEEVRLLANHDEAKSVMSIFLLGQPELRDILNHPRLLPLRQRIGTHYHLQPFSAEDTRQYISYRLRMAGAEETALFDEEALELIHEASLGNPRLINIICDQALMMGFSDEQPVVGADIIQVVLEEIKLGGEELSEISGVDHLQNSKQLLPAEESSEISPPEEKGRGGSVTRHSRDEEKALHPPISKTKILLLGGGILCVIFAAVAVLMIRVLLNR